MTALDEYQRLESTGLWRETDDDDPVEVVISFGTATLVLSTLDDAPVAHWSLSALEQSGTADGAVIYSPDADGRETLLISDPDMIAALEKVKAAHARGRKNPGRLRLALALLALACVAYWVIFWLPGGLERHVAASIPRAQAGLIGTELLADIKSRVGLECGDRKGVFAANKLAAALPGTGQIKLHVLELGALPTLALPGNHLLINKQAVASAQSPEEIAGWIASELARARALPPLLSITQKVTLVDNLRFLFTGGYTPETSVKLVEKLLGEPAEIPQTMDANALDILKSAKISPAPYAQALTRMGAEAARVKLFDVEDLFAEPVLDDQNWVALQGICNQG